MNTCRHLDNCGPCQDEGEALRAEIARLRAGLIEARRDIHFEFCSGTHHPGPHHSRPCRDATKALGPDAPEIADLSR